MIIVDYDNLDLAWEIIISGIKEMTSRWVVINAANSRIDCFAFDEIIIEDETHISWEILFVGGLDLKVVFKNISIRELGQEELERYRHPVKTSFNFF